MPAVLRNSRYYKGEDFAAHRTAFRRDRDSILYCNFFRRLAGVTQVVHVAEGHIFHNRLVHSLKVAQIGRSIVDILIGTANSQKNKDIMEAVGGVDGDVVETACLAHDLGHPPFGHIAESELDSCARENDVSDGFEGNPQSFRIVTRVAIHDQSHPGLNLTSASLNALQKYPWSRGVAGKKNEKWGHYYGDTDLFEFARARDPASDRRSAEAEIMDWADDVAYSIHDVDDFYRAGIVPLDRILAGGTETGSFLEKMKRDGKLDDVEVASKFIAVLREKASNDLLKPFQGTTAQYRSLRLLETFLIQRFLGVTNAGDLRLQSEGASRLHIAAERRREVKILKGLMQHYVYDAPSLVAQQYGQRRLIRQLFDIFLDAANGNAPAGILPAPFDERLKDIKDDKEAPMERVRLVMDVIASMTEQQAVTYFARLTGNSFGFIADRIFGA